MRSSATSSAARPSSFGRERSSSGAPGPTRGSAEAAPACGGAERPRRPCDSGSDAACDADERRWGSFLQTLHTSWIGASDCGARDTRTVNRMEIMRGAKKKKLRPYCTFAAADH